ncbi:MAG: hypothetical protein ACE5KZ_00090 [Candidatus Scalinduaceae bacterium]
MNDETYEHKIIARLIVSIAIVAIIALIVVYVYTEYNEKYRIYKLLYNAIPSAVVALAATPILYFLFIKRRFMFSKSNVNLDKDIISNKIIKEISMERFSQIINFHESYRHIDWHKLLKESSSTIDIIVYYYDSWVNSNYDDITSFFRKPGTSMRVFVANPNDSFIFSTIHRLFPDSGKEAIKEKVSKTGERLAKALKTAGGDSERLEFYYVPHILNYSAQCIDGKILILSIFEMFRESRIDSPAILIDLSKSKHITNFWHKELKGILNESEKVDIKLSS